jgi:hypothetical protein
LAAFSPVGVFLVEVAFLGRLGLGGRDVWLLCANLGVLGGLRLGGCGLGAIWCCGRFAHVGGSPLCGLTAMTFITPVGTTSKAIRSEKRPAKQQQWWRASMCGVPRGPEWHEEIRCTRLKALGTSKDFCDVTEG